MKKVLLTKHLIIMKRLILIFVAISMMVACETEQAESYPDEHYSQELRKQRFIDNLNPKEQSLHKPLCSGSMEGGVLGTLLYDVSQCCNGCGNWFVYEYNPATGYYGETFVGSFNGAVDACDFLNQK